MGIIKRLAALLALLLVAPMSANAQGTEHWASYASGITTDSTFIVSGFEQADTNRFSVTDLITRCHLCNEPYIAASNGGTTLCNTPAHLPCTWNAVRGTIIDLRFEISEVPIHYSWELSGFNVRHIGEPTDFHHWASRPASRILSGLHAIDLINGIKTTVSSPTISGAIIFILASAVVLWIAASLKQILAIMFGWQMAGKPAPGMDSIKDGEDDKNDGRTYRKQRYMARERDYDNDEDD